MSSNTSIPAASFSSMTFRECRSIAYILRVLQQLAVGDHPLKLRPIHEIVVNAVGLSHPGLPSGEGDGEVDVLPLAQQL
jgi:hypothetical protein